MTIQASLPSGFRDIDTEAFLQRKYITNILEQIFIDHNFQPLETPAMERLTTLLGKYGEEGDQLIFKVLNSRELTSANQEGNEIAKKGLRYDLTVPLARYIAQNKNAIVFPFKRYQIQPVWRAERAQKGRYREFYQCDIDIVGSDSLFHEASLLSLVYEALKLLGLSDFTIHLNHRALLSAIAEDINMQTNETVLYQILDKEDKIGIEGVCDLLREKGVSNTSIHRLKMLLVNNETDKNDPKALLVHLNTPLAQKAIGDLQEITNYITMLQPDALSSIQFTPVLARGISYYTGAIFEVKIPNTGIGSIVGGGRYDKLTNIFGLNDVSGVGLSFGLERIYDILKMRSLLPNSFHSIQILVVPMEKKHEKTAIQHVVNCRKQKIATEFYPAGSRMKKIFSYAHQKKIPWVAVIGDKEMALSMISLKNMHTGEQKLCTFAMVVQLISSVIKNL